MDCFHLYDLLITSCKDVKYTQENIEKILSFAKLKITDEIMIYGEPFNQESVKFFLKSNEKKVKSVLERQSNGAVFKITNLSGFCKCDLLVVPSNRFTHYPDKLSVEYYLNHDMYDIYCLRDGTTINTYYDGAWKYTSKNSPNIGEHMWRGYKYHDIILDTLAPYKCVFDKNCCYSFGFKHPAYHLFGQPAIWINNKQEGNWKKEAWMISGYSIKEHRPLKQTELELVGLPIQKPIVVKNKYKSIYNAIQNKCTKSIELFRDKNKVFLGYFMRSKSLTVPMEFSDLLFESSLYKDIKCCIYNPPPIKNKQLRIKMKEQYKDLRYVVLLTFLSIYKRTVFEKLFPQFKTQYQVYNELLDNVVEKIYNWIKTQPEKNGTDAAGKLASYFYPIVSGQFKVNNEAAINETFPRYGDLGRMKGEKKIIKDMILAPRYIDVYMNSVFNDK
jgi:hypothetical protein